MGFRVLLPQRLQGMGIGPAGPQIRFEKQRFVCCHHPLPGCCNVSVCLLFFLWLFGQAAGAGGDGR